jgi:hypothetical protein
MLCPQSIGKRSSYFDTMIHLPVTFTYFIRLRTQGDNNSKYLNNIVASRKNQSILSGFILKLSDDKILNSIFFVVNFKLYAS